MNIIPAYLKSQGIEFFTMNGDAFMLDVDGVKSFDEFDESTLNIVCMDFLADEDSQKGVELMRGNISFHEKLRQHLICKFGAFDTRTDIDEQGNIQTEWWDCGKHGNCPGEFKCCKPLHGENGKITPRLMDVLKKIGEGKRDNEISEELFIADNTAKNHRRKLQFLTGLKNKSQLAVFAIRNNIVQ